MTRTHVRATLSLGALAVVAAGMTPAAAHAIEFRSIAESAVVYDAPSNQGKPLFILRPGTPVEIVVTLDKWIKVREPGGSINWVERHTLAAKRTVLVATERARIRLEARDDAPVSFEAIRNVVLDVVEPPALGWVKVRHIDGQEGFARASEVWGL